jgi:hypothetical protein
VIESGLSIPAGTGNLGPSALKVTCALADAMAQICDELIEGPGQT